MPCRGGYSMLRTEFYCSSVKIPTWYFWSASPIPQNGSFLVLCPRPPQLWAARSRNRVIKCQYSIHSGYVIVQYLVFQNESEILYRMLVLQWWMSLFELKTKALYQCLHGCARCMKSTHVLCVWFCKNGFAWDVNVHVGVNKDVLVECFCELFVALYSWLRNISLLSFIVLLYVSMQTSAIVCKV